MPRLVASLGVVVALAVCIGFNTVRYPVVWDLVAVSHQLPQADPATKLAKAKPAEVKPAATASAASHPGYICTDGVCRMASARENSQPSAPPRPTVSVVTPATSPKPAAAKPAATTKPAATKPAAADKPAAVKPEVSVPQPAVGMLVPVTRPAASSQAATSRSKATNSAKGGVRRLPALDQMETPAADASQPQVGEQLPIYPTTLTR